MVLSTIKSAAIPAMLASTALAICLPTAAFAQEAAGPNPNPTAVSPTANADVAPGIGNNASGDIIVTARKRPESIQRTPISITAYTAQDLAARNISNFNDLANVTPGVAITSIAGGNVQNIYLRGVAPANTANDLNVEANVGVFIDGIYQTSRNTLDMISVLDVGQIEIAKGPQSALFGRSTFAGALSIGTKRPSHTLEANGSATVGVDQDYRVRASISGPLGGGFYARLSGGYLTYDGYGKNLANRDDNLGGYEKYAVNGAIEFAPSENFSALLSGFITHSKSELTPETLLPLTAFNCGTTTTSLVVGASVTSPRSQLYCGTLQAQKDSNLTPNTPDTTAKTRQVSLNLTGTFGLVRAVSITGLTAADNRAYNDYGGSADGVLFGVCTANCQFPFPGANVPYARLQRARLISTGVERVRTFSQELRFQSADKGSPFEWLVGANYFNQRVPLSAGGIGVDATGLLSTDRYVAVNQVGTPIAPFTGPYEFTANGFLVPDATTNQLFGAYTDSGTKAYSVFGSLGYKFGNFRVNAEGRYNIEKKRATNHSIANALSTPYLYQPINGTDVPAAGLFPTVASYHRTFKHFAPRITADYQATPDVFIYASAAKGYRSGGFNTANPVNASGILASEVAYAEESNWTYEAGFKSRFLDRKLLLNASIFQVDWKNAQVSAFTQNPTATTPARIVQNAGNIRVRGVEAQADYRFNDIFGLGGSVTYSDPKFLAGAYDGGSVTQCVIGSGATATAAPGCPPILLVTLPNGQTRAIPSLEGLRPQRSVKWQWNVHATLAVPVNADWKFSSRADVTYTGPAYNNLINTISFGKRTLVNARLGFESDHFGFFLWGNNLFDKTYVVNSINQPRAGTPFAYSVPEIYLGEGRRVGLTASAKF